MHLVLQIICLACLLYLNIALAVGLKLKSFTEAAYHRRELRKSLFILIAHPHHWYLYLFYEHCLRRFDSYHLCGHTLKEFFISDSFQKLGRYNGTGFCYVASTLAMLALNHKRSKIVRGYCLNKYGEKSFHSWVEVRYLGRRLCVDQVWFTPGIIPRKRFYAENKPDVVFTCPHRVFFGLSGIPLLTERLQSSETSYLFQEIIDAFYPRTRISFFGFYNVSGLERWLLNTDGRHFIDLDLDRVIAKEVFESTFDCEPA
ncbi:hypothetical protein FWF89_01290 [Candidatus Saccharibacteria bacterium]|nr:hypothetical protein [Candidatus Saccharibacteria bacterium]